MQQKERCGLGHIWVLVAPGTHVLFEYTRDQSGDAVDEMVAGYKGYLVADAHVGRKNWLFVGSDDGGEVNAIFISLLAPERANLRIGCSSWREVRVALAASRYRQLTLEAG